MQFDTFDLIDLTSRSLKAVPVALYGHAEAIVSLNLGLLELWKVGNRCSPVHAHMVLPWTTSNIFNLRRMDTL